MNYLFAAYLAIWILIFGYVLILSKREKQSRKELLLLKAALEKTK